MCILMERQWMNMFDVKNKPHEIDCHWMILFNQEHSLKAVDLSAC